jgi:hypothetical protein
MTIIAFSRKFPPNFRRRWYIGQNKKGLYLIRFKRGTIPIYLNTLNDALDIVGDISMIDVIENIHYNVKNW